MCAFIADYKNSDDCAGNPECTVSIVDGICKQSVFQNTLDQCLPTRIRDICRETCETCVVSEEKDTRYIVFSNVSYDSQKFSSCKTLVQDALYTALTQGHGGLDLGSKATVASSSEAKTEAGNSLFDSGACVSFELKATGRSRKSLKDQLEELDGAAIQSALEEKSISKDGVCKEYFAGLSGIEITGQCPCGKGSDSCEIRKVDEAQFSDFCTENKDRICGWSGSDEVPFADDRTHEEKLSARKFCPWTCNKVCNPEIFPSVAPTSSPTKFPECSTRQSSPQFCELFDPDCAKSNAGTLAGVCDFYCKKCKMETSTPTANPSLSPSVSPTPECYETFEKCQGDALIIDIADKIYKKPMDGPFF